MLWSPYMSNRLDCFSADSRSAADTQKVAATLGLPPKRYCLHVPTPKQLAFLLCPRSEAFFGGAAGPGKTEALLMGALQLVEQPRYSALLLRRTFRQLNQSNSIMNRARQWLANTHAVWQEAHKRFPFPPRPAVTFCHPAAAAPLHPSHSPHSHSLRPHKPPPLT